LRARTRLAASTVPDTVAPNASTAEYLYFGTVLLARRYTV
jgi:hypothetical protein